MESNLTCACFSNGWLKGSNHQLEINRIHRIHPKKETSPETWLLFRHDILRPVQGENMAFPQGDPAVFTVGPGQEMEETVIMTVEKAGKLLSHLVEKYEATRV